MDTNLDKPPEGAASTPPGSAATSQDTTRIYRSDVPPEIQPLNANDRYAGTGEPTRQWNAPPPPAQNQAPPPGAYSPPGANRRDMRRHYTPILGPFLLIAAGVVFLLNNLGYLPWNVWGQLWRLWPLILIVMGLDILLGRRSPVLSLLVVILVLGAGIAFVYANGGLHAPGNLTQSQLNVPVGSAKSANVHIELGGGELNLDSAAGSQLAEGTLGYYQNQDEPVHSVRIEGDTTNIDLRQGSGGLNFVPFFGQSDRIRWDVHLSPQVPTTLQVNTGAGNSDLNLEGLKLTDLNLDVGAGNTTITFPSSGAVHANVNGGVGNLVVVIPKGMKARITMHSGLGNTNINGDFTKQGDVYTSPGYTDDSGTRLNLTLDAGVGNITVRSK